MFNSDFATTVCTSAFEVAALTVTAGQRIYARNEILISLALKKHLHEDSPETTIKLKFQPTDTLSDIAKMLNEAIREN